MTTRNGLGAKRDVMQSIVSYLGEKPTIVMTLAYLQISTVGGVYRWSVLRQFGINMMDFAQPIDFLMGGFREPQQLALSSSVIIAVAMIAYGIRHYVILKQTLSSEGVRQAQIMCVAIAGVLVILCDVAVPSRLAYIHANRIRRGHGLGFVVELTRSDATATPEQVAREVLLITTTQDFAFFFDRQEGCARIVPFAGIGAITPTSLSAVSGMPPIKIWPTPIMRPAATLR